MIGSSASTFREAAALGRDDCEEWDMWGWGVGIRVCGVEYVRGYKLTDDLVGSSDPSPSDGSNNEDWVNQEVKWSTTHTIIKNCKCTHNHENKDTAGCWIII